MSVLSYRWWVPEVAAGPERTSWIRLLRDPVYVRGWMYAVVPALMAFAAATSAEVRQWPGMLAAIAVSAAWAAAVRARFAVAQTLAARRAQPIPITLDEPRRRAA